MELVLKGTLIQQCEGSEVFVQVDGIPMGGKASAEIANLYCYSIEAHMMAAARRNNTIMRDIDDMVGVGEVNWNNLPYKMEHKETTRLDGSVIFLGMKISKQEQQYLLEQQPKGVGWAWRPQKYLELTCTHTQFAKRSMFKGLCVRAGRITSTREAFKEAIHPQC